MNIKKKLRHNFSIYHTWHKYIICNKNYLNQEFQQLLNAPDFYMQKTILKSDHTTTISLVTINNQAIVVKRYNLKSFMHRIKRAIQPSRAAHCWRRAHQLLECDIATPKPIAFIENRWGIFRKQAYFIYEYVPGDEGFSAFNASVKYAVKKIRAEKTLQLITKLFQNRFSHGDMKASNFIYHDNKPYFIDLDAVQQHRFKYLFAKRRTKEIKRFLENWEQADIYKLFAEKL